MPLRALAALALSLAAIVVHCGPADAPSPPITTLQPALPTPRDRIDPSALGHVTFPWPAADLRARSLVLGCGHVCALLAGGHVECWGRNEFAELGDGTTTTRTTRAPVVGLPPVVELSGGCAFNCARTEAGAVWCWGGGDLGEIGDGDRAGHRARPVQVPGITARAIASSDVGTCAVIGDEGQASCWGTFDARAGAPISGDETRPRALATPLREPMRIVASSPSRSCVLARDGSVSCWGAREVLHVDVAPVDPAAPMTGIAHAHDLDGASFLTCASDAQGVACWGIGVPSFSLGGDPLPPTRIAGLAADAELAVGDDFVCGMSGAHASCAGYGELVDSVGRVHPLGATATRMTALDGLHGLVAGPSAACGLTRAGAVRCVAWLSGHEGERAPPPS